MDFSMDLTNYVNDWNLRLVLFARGGKPVFKHLS